jgi:hypothetical protein
MLEELTEAGPCRFLLDQPEALAKVDRWLSSSYLAPPSNEQIGSVFPEGIILISQLGDLKFDRPAAKVYVLYGDLDSRGRKRRIPKDSLKELFEIFHTKGTPYTGRITSGQYVPMEK